MKPDFVLKYSVMQPNLLALERPEILRLSSSPTDAPNPAMPGSTVPAIGVVLVPKSRGGRFVEFKPRCSPV
jgi:hypothetical protein